MYSRSVALLINKLVRASQVILALAVAAVVSPPAQAQGAPHVLSPLRVESDTNGVNLLTGQIKLQGPTLSVPAAPNLRFDRVQNLAPYVNGQRSGGFDTPAEGSYSVHTGTGTSDSFRCQNYDVCTSVKGSGAAFYPGAYSYREEGTGAVWNFTLMQYETAGSDGSVSLQYYATSVTHPNGEQITYTYDTTYDGSGIPFYRPTQVASSLGV